MKSWSVSVIDEPGYGAVLVFAESADRARSLAVGEWDVGYVDIQAATSSAAVPDGAAHRIATFREYRAAGWVEEDEPTCDSCGLSSWGFDEFAVCDVCRLCKECGCDDDEHADEEPKP